MENEIDDGGGHGHHQENLQIITHNLATQRADGVGKIAADADGGQLHYELHHLDYHAFSFGNEPFNRGGFLAQQGYGHSEEKREDDERKQVLAGQQQRKIIDRKGRNQRVAQV